MHQSNIITIQLTCIFVGCMSCHSVTIAQFVEREMRPIRALCVVLRILLLFAVLVASCLMAHYCLQLPALTTTTAATPAASPPLPRAREPYIDPAALLQSSVGHIDERLRVMAFRRLSHKLAGYAAAINHSSTPSSPESSQRRHINIASTSEPASVHISSSATPAPSEGHHGSSEESTPHSPPLQSQGNFSQNTAHDWTVTEKSSLPAELQASTDMDLAPHIRHDFHWPQPQAVRTTAELMSEQWMTDLQNSVKAMTSHEVTLLTSNQQYTEVLLNWLIAAVARASLDLSQVIVIAMDQKLHSLLEEKGVLCVLVRPTSLLSATGLRQGVFPAVMMTRLSIIRLLNHWGYDVFNYDTDAILLQDMSPVLPPGDDIIGTFGRFPTDLTKRWGITLCTAILAVRSSRRTEEFWEALSRASPTSFSDQGKVNYGLQALDVEWSLPSKRLASLSQTVQGVCRNGLRVSLLPYNVACRAGSCTHKALSAGLYLWHKGGARVGERKREGAQEGGVWFLRYDWSVGCDKMRQREWLKCISTGHMFTSK